MTTHHPTAAIIIIGNEVLSGRTQDSNTQYIARGLASRGIILGEVRVIPDIENVIVETVNSLRKNYSYVFTTGGIGPTHDDITSASISKAFGVPCTQHPEAYRRLKGFYDDRNEPLNDARARMTYTPQGANLIDNSISVAPGIIMENVYVMAGIPSICQSMFDSIKDSLAKGALIESASVKSNLIEGDIATELAAIQKHHPEVEIGSYPTKNGDQHMVEIVMRSTNPSALSEVEKKATDLVISKGGKLFSA
jgi:molybdenum cofactor synthesis domain-containing protein